MSRDKYVSDISELNSQVAPAPRRMPEQKPGRSKQDYATPRPFLEAVKRKFGIPRWDYDLAASPENTVAQHFFCEEENSLAQDWDMIPHERDGVALRSLWLNPPFANIAPWAAKCALYQGPARIFFLVPAAVGSNWWRDSVHERANVFFLNGRLSFDGVGSYPKDTALCLYPKCPNIVSYSEYSVWNWKKDLPK